MRFLEKVKDGGEDSPVDAYVLIEIKSLFSIMLLKFNRGHRDCYHSHAFHAITLPLSGDMIEIIKNKKVRKYHNLVPKFTSRGCLHKVYAFRDSWALTLRGRWNKTWIEEDSSEGRVLTNGRKIVEKYSLTD